MQDPWLVLVAAVVGMLLGGLMTFRFAVRAHLTTLERNLRMQLTSAELQLRMQLEADARQRQQERLEESYGKLMGWLYELDVVIDGIWIAIHSTDKAVLDEARTKLEKWPWTTLKPPQYVASTQHYWSVAVRDLLGKFYGDTLKFVTGARTVLNPDFEREDRDEVGKWAVHQTWDERNKLQGAIVRIREQARTELLQPDYDTWRSVR